MTPLPIRPLATGRRYWSGVARGHPTGGATSGNDNLMGVQAVAPLLKPTVTIGMPETEQPIIENAYLRRKRTDNFGSYGQARPGETAVRTAVPGGSMVRMGSPVRFRRGGSTPNQQFRPGPTPGLLHVQGWAAGPACHFRAIAALSAPPIAGSAPGDGGVPVGHDVLVGAGRDLL